MDDSLQTTYYTLTLSRTGDRLQTANLVDQTSYTITGLALDTTYTVTIHAANLCGRGPDSSATVSFSTGTYIFVSQYFHYGVIVIASAYLLVFTLGRMNTLCTYICTCFIIKCKFGINCSPNAGRKQ